MDNCAYHAYTIGSYGTCMYIDYIYLIGKIEYVLYNTSIILLEIWKFWKKIILNKKNYYFFWRKKKKRMDGRRWMKERKEWTDERTNDQTNERTASAIIKRTTEPVGGICVESIYLSIAYPLLLCVCEPVSEWCVSEWV